MAGTSWEDLVERTEGGPVTRGTMFGSQGLRTGTKYFAIWWHEQLVVKLPADRLREVVAGGQGRPFERCPDGR
jgi:TfoX/Sxy family transcriptional regulator of competence genes